jgi:chromosome segregation ATPase
MVGYRIKALNEWAPEGPAYSCPDIDDAIESMENVRKANEELRSSLGNATEVIQTLDQMVLDLQADLDARQSDLQASDELIGRMEDKIKTLENGLEEVLEENKILEARIETLLDQRAWLERQTEEVF